MLAWSGLIGSLGVAPEMALSVSEMAAGAFLAWWGPGQCGYVDGIRDAGQYSRAAAVRICREALPSSAQAGVIAEVPVRLDDVAEILQNQIVLEAVLGKTPEWPTCG